MMNSMNYSVDRRISEAGGGRSGLSQSWARLGHAHPERIRGSASVWLWRLVAVQVLVWTVVPALVNITPQTDTLEGYLWGREWPLLTYKHPQLPAWMLQIMHDLTGSYTWGHYFLSQAMVAVTFLVVYALGRAMLGPRAALAGVLLLPTTGFFSWGTRQFNHDIVQMPFWAGISWLLWMAARTNRIGWWVALGVVGGAALYAKFEVALILIFGLVWLIADPAARRLFAGKGPWVAMAIVLAFAAPIFVTMAHDNFMQLTYAVGRSGETMATRGRFYFIGVQIMLMLIFALALRSTRLMGRHAELIAPGHDLRLGDAQARTYLLWMGLGPIALLLAASLFTGVAEAWSKPMYNLVGLIAVAYLGGRLTKRAMRRVLIWGFAMSIGTALAYGVYAPTQCYIFHDLTHACVPAPEIARTLETDWHRSVDTPIGIVAGEEEMSMAVGVFLPDAPSMFTDFDPAHAPWITPERIARQGLLVVWTTDANLPAPAEPWIANRPVGQESFGWANGAPPIVVHYVIVPPKGVAP